MIEINISKDFTNKPGGRYNSEGPSSGELFRDEILLPAFNEAKRLNVKLRINLDDCYGYATSFLEEAFGGLARIIKDKNIKDKNIIDTFIFISNDEPGLIELINQYITDAQK